MFCKNCGAENYDGARFCVGCGTDLTPAPAQPVYEEPVYQEPVQAPVQEAPAEGGFEQTLNNVKEGATDAFNKAADFGKNYMEEAKKDKKKLIIPIVAGVAVIALLIVLFSALFGGGYKTALNNYYKKYLIGKATQSTIKNMYPDEYWDENDIDPEDIWESYEEYSDDMVDSLEDEYGKNLRVTYKITDKDKMDKDDLKDLASELHEEWGVKKKSVKQAYELELEVTIKGSEDEETDDMDVVVVKIGSKWYIVD